MKNILIPAIAFVALSGCATVFTGSKSGIINIAPSSGAKVQAEISGAKGIEKTTLPTMYSAKRANEEVYVKITDPCYDETSYVIEPEITPAFYANILFGLWGITGTIVDSSTGNLWQYDNAVTVPANKKPGC